jgi:hypothetical protein
MGILDPIVQALQSPGPVTDHSIHTTTQLPVPQGRIDTNQKKAQNASMEQLRAGKNGPKPY